MTGHNKVLWLLKCKKCIFDIYNTSYSCGFVFNTAVSKDGKEPFEYACDNGHEEAALFLRLCVRQ